MENQTFTLPNGIKIPQIGFGCAFGNWSDSTKEIRFQPDLAWKAVSDGLQAGYRCFDGALGYGTHQIVGQTIGKAFAKGKLKREDVFIQSKVFAPTVSLSLNRVGNTVDVLKYANDPSLDLKERILYDIEKCLSELNLGYLDLLLLHWPGDLQVTDKETARRLRKQAWQALEEAYTAGKVKAIGVSNFLIQHFETFLEDCTIQPMVNQIEVNPYISQANAVEYCQSKGILVQSWGPFGSGATGVLQDPVILQIAEKYKKNPGQVILRYLNQKGIAAIPKSSSFDRMKSNLNIFDFILDQEDIRRIAALNQNKTSAMTSDSIL